MQTTTQPGLRPYRAMTSFPLPKTAGILWISVEDWARYVSLCADGDKLPQTYEGWVAVTERVIENISREGWDVMKVDADLAEFAAWCKQDGLNIDRTARIRYADEIAAVHISARDRSLSSQETPPK